MGQHRPLARACTRIGVAFAATATAILVGLPATTASVSARTNRLAPASLTTTAGTVGTGQTHANLAVQDQTGTADN